jgi:hypothetical protein
MRKVHIWKILGKDSGVPDQGLKVLNQALVLPWTSGYLQKAIEA